MNEFTERTDASAPERDGAFEALLVPERDDGTAPVVSESIDKPDGAAVAVAESSADVAASPGGETGAFDDGASKTRSISGDSAMTADIVAQDDISAGAAGSGASERGAGRLDDGASGTIVGDPATLAEIAAGELESDDVASIDGAGFAGRGAETSAEVDLSLGHDTQTSDDDATTAASLNVPKELAGPAVRQGRSAAAREAVADLTFEPLEEEEFRSALEALLLIVDAPAPVELLADALQDRPARVEQALHQMSAQLSARGSGIDLRFVGDGWRFYTRSEYAPYVERLLLDGARSKLTRAALETLAVVAYRQPVTRTRVSAVRGVNVDGVMRTLLARGLIAEAGVDPETNGTQYCTTELFLERIGLASLTDLPPLAPLLPGVDLIDEINESLDTDPRYTRLRKPAEADLDLGTED